MSIFDVLTNGSLGSVLDSIAGQAGSAGGVLGNSGMGSVLDSLGKKARSAATNIRDNTPGGLGGLAGAGALGALLGNVLSGDLMRSVALAGAGAVAWNFYKKWAGQQTGQSPRQVPGSSQSHSSGGYTDQEMPKGWGGGPTEPVAIDPVADLVLRTMIYAARADGNIDKDEQSRIDQILKNMLPGQDVSGPMQRIRTEMLDPNKIAMAVGSPEQAEDVYRLSCAIIEPDHFMEHSYLQTLAQALGISPADKRRLESEADQARKQLADAVGHQG